MSNQELSRKNGTQNPIRKKKRTHLKIKGGLCADTNLTKKCPGTVVKTANLKYKTALNKYGLPM